MKNTFQALNSKSKFPVAFHILLLLLCFTFAANAQDGNSSVKSEEENLNLINEIPKHLPIKIEIINGKSEDVLGDVEVKVTNTGSKPIYYLKFFVTTTKDFSLGDRYGAFDLKYGRAALITFTESANESDIPLKKGESYTFKIDEKENDNFKQFVSHRLQIAAPQKFLLRFQFLSFGDSTDFGRPEERDFLQNQKVHRFTGQHRHRNF